MPLNLITGLPGHGKTLFALTKIKERAEREERVVYYHGIPELSLPWIELPDPALWFEVPQGSIVVIDECQRVFPPRNSSSPVPRKCSEFETHRHHGLDIYLLTQHPRLIDEHVRALCSPYFHLQRKLGQMRATVWQYPEVCTRTKTDKEGAIHSYFPYPKSTFALYKSSAEHTIKRQFPAKLLGLPLALAVIVFALYSVYNGLTGAVAEAVPITSTGDQLEPATGTLPAGLTISPAATDYPAKYTPVAQEYPESAPVYADLVKITDYPRIDLCYIYNGRCRCLDQQGNQLPDVPALTCRHTVQYGKFRAHAVEPLPARQAASLRATGDAGGFIPK